MCEAAGVMDIIPLTEAIKERPFHWFEFVDGRVQTVQYRNSADHPVMNITMHFVEEAELILGKDAHLISWIDLGVIGGSIDHHDGGTGDIASIDDGQRDDNDRSGYPQKRPKTVEFSQRNDRPIDEWQLESLGKLFYPSEGKRVYGQGFQLMSGLDRPRMVSQRKSVRTGAVANSGWLGLGLCTQSAGPTHRTWPNR